MEMVDESLLQQDSLLAKCMIDWDKYGIYFFIGLHGVWWYKSCIAFDAIIIPVFVMPVSYRGVFSTVLR